MSGCWDRREIEEQSTVLATGVDLCDDGQGCSILVTRQFAIPGRIPLGTAGGEGGGGRSGETVFVVASPGKDGPDTGAQVQAELNRPVTFGHTRIFVISESFARRDAETYFDYVRRIPAARRLMWVLVSEGRAGDVLQAKPPLERVPALFLTDMLNDAVKGGRLPRVFWGDFLVRLSNRGEDAIAPLVRMASPNEPELSGLAVFREYQMVGKLNPQETATFMQIQGLPRGAEVMRINLPGGEWADIQVYGRGSSHRLNWRQGRIHDTIKMELETELVQADPAVNSADSKTMKAIEEAMSGKVAGRATALLKRLQQEWGTDILAMGERVRARMPAVWRTIPDWRAAFADAEVRFDVKVHVRRTGMAKD